MYDDFSSDYDRFVDWPGRLAAELPFIEHQLQAVGARRVLDAACGTGMHALALARRGYAAVGADLSPGMIARARANAAAAGVDVPFEVAGFGELNARVGTGFDALLCLGNSLPHLLAPAGLESALADFAACLRPGGLVLIQNRNFDAVLSRGDDDRLELRAVGHRPRHRRQFDRLRPGAEDEHGAYGHDGDRCGHGRPP